MRPGIAILVVYLLTMGPDGSADPGDTVRLAESAIAALSPEEALGAQRYLGAALYRAGRYAEAVSHLESGAQRPGRDGGPWNWAFLAMAHTRLGHDAESRRWLEHFPPGPTSAEGPTRSRPSMTSRSTCSAARPRRWCCSIRDSPPNRSGPDVTPGTARTPGPIRPSPRPVVDVRGTRRVAGRRSFVDRQFGEQIGERGLIVLPSPDRSAIDRLADLGDAGSPDRSLGAVKLQAGRLPLEAARRDQPARIPSRSATVSS